jgi:hypothetical protein
MTTSFPSGLDSFTNPSSGDTLASPDHAAQHADVNDAVEALQAKVGVDGSAVTTSLDYRVSNVEVGKRFLGRAVISTSGTYSLSSLVSSDVLNAASSVKVIAAGGGGGSGRVNVPNNGYSVGYAGAGGALASLAKTVDAGFITSTVTVTIGAGGAGQDFSGSPAAVSGGNTTITFNYDSSSFTATGGSGGGSTTTNVAGTTEQVRSQTANKSGTWATSSPSVSIAKTFIEWPAYGGNSQFYIAYNSFWCTVSDISAANPNEPLPQFEYVGAQPTRNATNYNISGVGAGGTGSVIPYFFYFFNYQASGSTGSSGVVVLEFFS